MSAFADQRHAPQGFDKSYSQVVPPITVVRIIGIPLLSEQGMAYSSLDPMHSMVSLMSGSDFMASTSICQ